MNENYLKKYLKYVRIERYVNKVKFSGITMGGTLNDQFQYCERYGSPSIKATTKFLLKDSLRLILSIFRKNSFIMTTRVIGTWIKDKPQYTNIMVPLIEHFNKNITVIYNPEIKNVDQLYNANFISIRETFTTPVNYLPSLIRFISVILFAFITKRKRLNLNFRELYYYIIELFHKAKIIAFYDNQFKNQMDQVRLVITEQDRIGVASPLVLTAKKHGIKTVTLVHGTMEGMGFTPLLADYIFCHGEIQKNQLSEQGVSTDKIKVTGTTIIPAYTELEKRRKQKDSFLRICLGISPIKREHLNSMIKTVIEAVSAISSVELIIKLHPSHKKEKFIHLQNQHNNIKVLSSKEINNMDLFGEIDLLIINFSGLGIEAMYQKIPVLLMKTHKGENSFLNLIEKWSNLPVFETSGELRSMLSVIMADSKYLDDLNKMGKEFADKYYYATGSEAFKNIIDELTKITDL